MSPPQKDLSGIGSGSQWFGVMDHLTHGNRFVLLPEPHLGIILDACKGRITTLPRGANLYRSRVRPPARDSTALVFTEKDMLPPPPHLTPGGRLNPEGMPYLYLAKDEITAIAEQRPWIAAPIVVGTFELTEDVTLYDLTPPPERASAENFVIRSLGKAFSTPAHRDDRGAYGPTQFFSEQLKALGARSDPPVRGIQYPSALHPDGVNVALFNSGGRREKWSIVKCLDVDLWTVTAVTIGAKKVPQRSVPSTSPP